MEEGVAGVVEATKEVLTGDGRMILLDEVLFEGVMVEAGVVLLLVIMSYDDYEVIVIR